MAQAGKLDNRDPLIIPRSDHTISRANIPKSALKVLYRLKDSGYEAFLVGGSVRDLLLGGHPKDFDVATDARPEQVRALFKNSRLIGRRFRLAHVRFGRELIEVATFRGTGADVNGESQVLSESGRILSDNVYGSIHEDALRRDFTINALYYNIKDFSIWDFADGVADIRSRCLRLIGDPERRYREDPVRMLRAARFAAKLGFELHTQTAEPIGRMASLIDGIPAARLFDEFLKLFQSGHALATYRLLREFGLLEHLFPATAQVLVAHGDRGPAELIERALANTDQRIAEDRPVTPMFLLGVLLWYPVSERAAELHRNGELSESQALAAAAGELSAEQSRRIAVPRRFSLPMREMLQLQLRFANRRGRRAVNLLSHRRFRAAYDLLALRVAVGDVDTETLDFWTEVQEMSPAAQRKAFGIGGRRRRGSGNRRRAAATR